MKYLFISILLCSSIFAKDIKWGWEAHGYINEHAVDYLPVEMSFFKDHRSYLQQHSTDPDRDQFPSYYHYIDIDYYPEFFTGTLPHNLDSLLKIYSQSTIEDQGTIPWVIEEWTESLSVLMAAGQWDDVWQIAAELGHYVADSHQPLHLTLNYNGQYSGNYGIHSRYESQMINRYISQISLADGEGKYWPNVIDSVFLYIEEIYPYVDSILIADDLAFDQDPNYNTTYYNILWQELEPLTTISINRAIIDLASLWRTAWENAGRPSPLSIHSQDESPGSYFLADAYPNPFNPKTVISWQLAVSSYIELRVFNLLGQKIETLVSGVKQAGHHKVEWNAGNLPSGVYYYMINAGDFHDVKKMVLLQ